MGDINEMVKTAEMFPPAPREYTIEAWEDEEEPSTATPAWRCNDRGTADWIMRRLAALRAEAAAIEAQKAAAIERVEKRAADLLSRIERGIGFFTYHLADYCQREKATLLGGGKKKSAEMLHGRIGWRKKGGKLRVTDKAALVAWLEHQPPEDGLYRLKVEPDMAAIQARFRAAGEIPPGCEYELEEDVFYTEPLKLEE